MGLPIIIIKPKERVKFPDHFREEIDIRVTEVEGIVNAINLALSDKYWNEFLEKREKYFRKILYSTDGQSAKRIAEVIKRLVKK